MAECKRSYVPCNAFARETWGDSLGAPTMLVKNGFMQEYYEVLEAVPRAHTADFLPYVDIAEESEEDSFDDSTLTTPLESEESEEPIPETADAQFAEEVHTEQLGYTTLMIRNLPTRATQQTLLKTWPPDGSYDFLYVPFSFEKHRNIGYAFINFVTHTAAIDFFNAWHEKLPAWTNAKKPLEISWALVQGRDKNLMQFTTQKISRIKNVNYQPALFEGTTRLSLHDVLALAELR